MGVYRIAVAMLSVATLLAGCGATREQGPPTVADSEGARADQRDRSEGVPDGEPVTIDFEGEREGGGASEFEPLLGQWVIRQDPSSLAGPTVYAQTSTQDIKPPDTGAERLFGKDYQEYLDQIGAYQVFPSTAYSGGAYRDFEASVYLKPISGEVDQSGGLIFRVVSPKDYYIWRCNVLEQNCELYVYENGERRSVFQADVPLEVGQWRQIRVVAEGNRIRGFLDERELMDDEFGDTSTRGRVGLWTKADAITNFDGFQVEPR